MKKIIPYIIFMLWICCLCGCSSVPVNFREKTFTVNVGSTISTSPSEYVRASKQVLAEMSVDVSEVDTALTGTYTAYITYKGIRYDFPICVSDTQAPAISLKRDSFYFENGGSISLDDVVESITDISDYEYGFSDNITAADQDKNMNKSITFNETGTYNCEIIAKDSYGNCSVKGFSVEVVEAGKIPEEITGDNDYRPYMNDSKGVNIDDIYSFPSDGVYYGVGNNVDAATNRPNLAYYELKYGKYKVDFIHPDSRYVWLTFNEIYEYGNTVQVLDTLKDKEVSAVFFITLNYAKNNPELIERMINEGHVIGNYTANCADVPELSVNSLTTELDMLYNYLYETYGYEMYLFRTPSGYFSEQALALAQQSGYRTVFWSFAYSDWDVNNQPDITSALQNALNRAHGGAIYQLSGSSATNMGMLSDLIDGIRDKGFEFAIYQKK